MKTINNETASIIQEFLENHKKVDIKEVKQIYEHIYSESGELIYNSHLVMTDIDKILENVQRYTNMELCKYHMTILAILFEGCGIYPPEGSPFYEVSNNKDYKVKILAKEADDIMSTKCVPFIETFVKGSYTASIIANIIINDALDITNTDDDELNKMREFDQIYNKIFKSKLMEHRLDDLLVDTGACVHATVNIKYKSKLAKSKLSESSMDIIYKTLENYGIPYKTDVIDLDDDAYMFSGDDEDETSYN